MRGADPVPAVVAAPVRISVCAVVVTYRPDPAALQVALDVLRPQVEVVLVVDNHSPQPSPPSPDIVYLRQSSNVGLATAQNVGIEWARQAGHTHVLVLDQDSIPAPDMVAHLVDAWRQLCSTTKVGALGPRFHDPREGRDAPFVRVAFPMSHKLRCDATTEVVPCDFLISSGALIALAVLDDVGGMDDGLFIDNVDLEWSFRARASGYALFGVCAATMEHHLGDHRQAVLGGRFHVVQHGPTRLYYIMRNRVALYRRRHTPRVWIAQDLPRVVAKFLIFSILVGPRGRNVEYMLRGLADGLRGRGGPCPIGGSRD